MNKTLNKKVVLITVAIISFVLFIMGSFFLPFVPDYSRALDSMYRLF